MPARKHSAGKSKAPRRRKAPAGGAAASAAAVQPPVHAWPSALLDTRVIPARRDCGDCLDHASEPRPSGSGSVLPFEDRHASTAAYIDYMRPRCVELARVVKKTGSFYYHCDWHASHYVKVMVDQILAYDVQHKVV